MIILATNIVQYHVSKIDQVYKIMRAIKFTNLYFTRMKILVHGYLKCIGVLTFSNSVCNPSQPFPAYALRPCNSLSQI